MGNGSSSLSQDLGLVNPSRQSTRPRAATGASKSNKSDDISTTLTRAVSSGIRDLTFEVQLQGEFPVFVNLDYSIWPGKLGENTEVAIKLLRAARTHDTQEQLLHDFVREAVLWSRAMHHENVMPLLGVARLDDSVAFISPWMEKGDLGTYLRAHRDVHVERLFADVACGLEHLHSHGIVYGILRSSTVLVSSPGRAHLSSFLVAHTQEGSEYGPTDMLMWRVESLAISHPEDASFEGSRRLIATPESDVFAFGTMIMEVLMDRNLAGTPYSRRNSHVLKNSLEGKPERPRSLHGLSDGIWNVVLRCWQRDPKQRPNMSEVARIMVELADASATTWTDMIPPTGVSTPESEQPKVSPRTLRDISAEIRKISEHPIAGGGFCDLYLGERLGSEKVALKLVRFYRATKQDRNIARRRFLSEAWLWASFQHPRILQFYGVCQHGDLAYFMVSPFLKNGNVMEYLANIEPNADRRRLLFEAAEGLLYLHSRCPPVVHGDMKGANILITDSGSAVVTDFGLSKISHEATTTMLQGAGSPRWMSPELVLSGDKEAGPLKTPKSDVYAFGHVMLEVLSNKLPFFDVKEDLHVLVDLIRGGRSPRPDGPVADKWLDDAAWEFSRRCTAINPDVRPDMENIVLELHPPSFKDIGSWLASVSR